MHAFFPPKSYFMCNEKMEQSLSASPRGRCRGGCSAPWWSEGGGIAANVFTKGTKSSCSRTPLGLTVEELPGDVVRGDEDKAEPRRRGRSTPKRRLSSKTFKTHIKRSLASQCPLFMEMFGTVWTTRSFSSPDPESEAPHSELRDARERKDLSEGLRETTVAASGSGGFSNHRKKKLKAANRLVSGKVAPGGGTAWSHLLWTNLVFPSMAASVELIPELQS